MKQKSKAKAIAVAPLLFLVSSVGCESIALLPRPAIDDRADLSRRDLDRRELDRRPESRVDGRMTVIKYDPATVVHNREREMPVDDLRYGDLILIKVVKNNRGEQYADLIRLAS